MNGALNYLAAGAELEGLRQWLASEHGTLALDTETTNDVTGDGRDIWAAGFRCTQVALCAADGTGFILDGSAVALVRDALACLPPTLRVWAHNASFDRDVLAAAYGVLPGLLDSVTLAYAVRPELIGGRNGGASLKVLRPETHLAQDRLRAHWEGITGGEVDDAGWLSAATAGLPADDPALLSYVSTDAVETARLVDDLRDGADKDARAAALLEARVDRIWHRATLRGFRVDTDRLGVEVAKLEEVQAASVAKFGCDLTSASEATRAWVASRGIRIQDGKGQATLSKDFYATAFVPPEAGDDWSSFLEIRRAGAARNALTGFRTSMVNGRIHSRFSVLGAVTGRTISSAPNLQNIAPHLRPIFTADEGMTLLGADFDSVEPRVMAAMSGDAAALAAVQALDVYTEMAVQVWGPSARGDKALRAQAKTSFLATGYGQGAPALAAQLGIPIEDAQDLRDGFRRQFPRMLAWGRSVVAAAEAGRHQTTGYGRYLPLPQEECPTSPRHFRAVNWLVQGTGADVLKQVTARVAERLGSAALWVPIHDELILQVPDTAEGRERGLAALAEAMNFDFRGVPITATPEIIGLHWYKLGQQPAHDLIPACVA